MKKQYKYHLKSQERGDYKLAHKNDTVPETDDKIRNKLNKYQIMSPPNKENLFLSANHNVNMLSPLSPVAHQIQAFNMQSPVRTTPHDMLECMRSNKSKEALEADTHDSRNDQILFSGLSKDGRYRVQSRALQGGDLAKAVQYEKKAALNGILLAEKQKANQKIPHLDPAKTSNKQNGIIKAYAVNTHQGISRGYNEDRVSITLNIKKNGVRTQFFAIYDGHGGSNCCQFLKDNLHNYLINHKQFPSDPKKSLSQAIMACENKFCQITRKNKTKEGQLIDRSGSCVLIALLVDDYCYVANVGDSRAILSTEGGKFAFNLSRDHRPTEGKEQERIMGLGGKIYRTEMNKINQNKAQHSKNDTIIGPLRIFPGKLSVSRTIGDLQAKDKQFGGMRGVITAEPQIRKFKLSSKQDFILLCCDGILQKMQSMQVIEVAWAAMRVGGGNIHQMAGRGADAVIKQSMRRRSSDNLTSIIICLSDLTKQKTPTISKLNNYRSV